MKRIICFLKGHSKNTKRFAFMEYCSRCGRAVGYANLAEPYYKKPSTLTELTNTNK